MQKLHKQIEDSKNISNIEQTKLEISIRNNDELIKQNETKQMNIMESTIYEYTQSVLQDRLLIKQEEEETVYTAKNVAQKKNKEVNDKLDGLVREWYDTGNLMISRQYSNGLLHGEVKTYYETGELFEATDFNYGTPKYKAVYRKDGSLADEQGFLNKQIIDTKGHDFQIGHSYFMGENNDLVKRMNLKVIPLLMEYYMNDEKEVKSILINAGLQLEEDHWPLRITGKRD